MNNVCLESLIALPKYTFSPAFVGLFYLSANHMCVKSHYLLDSDYGFNKMRKVP